MAHPPPAARRTIGNWEITEVLGSGSFAIVWKARHTTTGTLAAVKEVLTDRLNKKLLESLESEIATLQRLKHANIVGLLDLFKEPGKIYLVLEYCGGGDLAQYLRHRGPLSEASCRYLLRHLAEGLKVLRAHNIIHRDLKPQNLLLSDSGPSPTLKIADFGFARSLQPAGMAETLCGSPLYMAPEVLQLARYDAKADLWSVGTILFELLAGRPPFQGANHLQLVQNIERGDAVLPDAVARTLTPGCRQLLHQLLRRNPVERISHDELFAHPFLQGEAASAAVALPAPIAAAVAALAAQEPPAPPGPLQPPAAQQRHVPVSQGAVRFITPAGRDRSPVHPLLRPTPGTSPNNSTSPPAPCAAAVNVSKSQESAAPIHGQLQQHKQQQPTGAAGQAGGVAAVGHGVGVVAPAPGRVAPAAAAGAAPAISVREVIHRSPSPHVAATTAAVESVFMEGAAAAAHAAAATANARAAAAGGGGGGDALAESSDSDYVVVCSPSSTPRHQQPAQLLSPRTQHPAISNSGNNSRSNSGGGAPPSPNTAHPAMPAAAQAKPLTPAQPAAQWQQALPPIAAATLPHTAQPAHTPAGATTFTIRVPGPQPASGGNGGDAIAGAGAGGGGDGDVQLLPRVISLLLDHAKARCTSLLDQEAEARQFGAGGVGASGLGGWGDAVLAGTEEGAGMAEEAAEAVGTLLVAVRLLAAALSSRSAAAAAAPGNGSGGGAAGEAKEAPGAAAGSAVAVDRGAAQDTAGTTEPKAVKPTVAGPAQASSSPFAAGPAPLVPDTASDTGATATAAGAATAAEGGGHGQLTTAASLRSLAVQARDALALMDEHMHGTVAQLLLGGADVAAAAAATGSVSSAAPPLAAAAAPPPQQPLVPCALDALMATAVRHSRAAAGEELLGHAAGAAEHYGAAADVLAFLLATPLPPGGGGASQLRHPAAVAAPCGGGGDDEGGEASLSHSELLLQSVRPPLAPHDRQRLTKYYAAVKLRQSAAAAAAAAAGAAAGGNHNHYGNTNNYYPAAGAKGVLPQPHGAAAVGAGAPAAGVYGMYGNRHQGAFVY